MLIYNILNLLNIKNKNIFQQGVLKTANGSLK
jgi:hypothetical protein